MGRYVFNLREVDQAQVALVGGKGANLGDLSRLEGLRVPADVRCEVSTSSTV